MSPSPGTDAGPSTVGLSLLSVRSAGDAEAVAIPDFDENLWRESICWQFGHLLHKRGRWPESPQEAKLRWWVILEANDSGAQRFHGNLRGASYGHRHVCRWVGSIRSEEETNLTECLDIIPARHIYIILQKSSFLGCFESLNGISLPEFVKLGHDANGALTLFNKSVNKLVNSWACSE